MKKIKKWMMTVCMSMMLLTAVTGCAKTTQPPSQTKEETGNRENDQAVPEESDDEAGKQTMPEESDDEVEKQTKLEEPSDDEDAESHTEEQARQDEGSGPEEQSAPRKVAFREGTEHLGGKVQSITDDGMIFAQTTILGEDSMVTLVDEKDAKKTSVKFTADTKVEHWVIQGGGAGIERQDAAVSDIRAGQGVELEGNYEGDIFVAAKVLIEEYK